MEKKMKRIAFDMERAKSITEGREPGRVVTGDGEPVRLLCFNKKTTGDWIIVGLVDRGDYEDTRCYNRNGEHSSGASSSYLWLEVPEENALKPFDKVLVKDTEHDAWKPHILGVIREKPYGTGYIYKTLNGADWRFCIPYEGNEHLLKFFNTLKENK